MFMSYAYVVWAVSAQQQTLALKLQTNMHNTAKQLQQQPSHCNKALYDAQTYNSSSVYGVRCNKQQCVECTHHWHNTVLKLVYVHGTSWDNKHQARLQMLARIHPSKLQAACCHCSRCGTPPTQAAGAKTHPRQLCHHHSNLVGKPQHPHQARCCVPLYPAQVPQPTSTQQRKQ
jgi:hypothetical protein